MIEQSDFIDKCDGLISMQDLQFLYKKIFGASITIKHVRFRAELGGFKIVERGGKEYVYGYKWNLDKDNGFKDHRKITKHTDGIIVDFIQFSGIVKEQQDGGITIERFRELFNCYYINFDSLSKKVIRELLIEHGYKEKRIGTKRGISGISEVENNYVSKALSVDIIESRPKTFVGTINNADKKIDLLDKKLDSILEEINSIKEDIKILKKKKKKKKKIDIEEEVEEEEEEEEEDILDDWAPLELVGVQEDTEVY